MRCCRLVAHWQRSNRRRLLTESRRRPRVEQDRRVGKSRTTTRRQFTAARDATEMCRIHVSRWKENSGLGGFDADAASGAGGATAVHHPRPRGRRGSPGFSVGDDAEARIAPGHRWVQLRSARLRSGWVSLWRCSVPSTSCRSRRGIPTGRERSTSTRLACGRTRTRGTSSGAVVPASASGSQSGSGGGGRRRRTVTSRSTSRTSPRNGQSLRPRASRSLARPSTRAFVIWRSSPIPMGMTACCTAGTRPGPDAGIAARRPSVSSKARSRLTRSGSWIHARPAPWLASTTRGRTSASTRSRPRGAVSDRLPRRRRRRSLAAASLHR
jgi:hypothetical protein